MKEPTLEITLRLETQDEAVAQDAMTILKAGGSLQVVSDSLKFVGCSIVVEPQKEPEPKPKITKHK